MEISEVHFCDASDIWLSCASCGSARCKANIDLQAAGPMSDNVMRMVFGDGRLDPQYKRILDELQIIVVAIDPVQKARWVQSDFWKRCIEDNLSISFLEAPCSAKPV